ncbi:hypothetical protein K435DRAFT_861886 [Dendrothele bispora CBS 962.96]|uniref:Uncharacterized protein n=1 Tax=Dendrothele bispora (strain CBS 962.96) TaxID=1314807 RepID=A0A4S8LU03_DENBC|nr:hypothetical protein K435DRAFT_861886 [Dendrothele bispora CBS 962.96]
MINQDCLEFQRKWNSKPVSGHGGLSPDEMLLDGMLKHGIYLDSDPPDDCVGLTVEETMESYDVHSKVQRHPHGHSGAGYSQEDPIDNLEHSSSSGSESEESEWEEVETFHEDKFTAPPVKEAGIIPDGYGMHPEEWEHVFPLYYTIRSVRKGSQELQVQLPDLVWCP